MKWDPWDIISYHFLSLRYPMGSLGVSLRFLGVPLESKWDSCCYQCLSLMYVWGSLGLKDAPLIFNFITAIHIIRFDVILFHSPRIGAIVVGVTAVLVIGILVVYVIKANLKRSRAISVRPVTKVHYSKGQTSGHVSIIHLSDGHGGNPSMYVFVLFVRH